MTWNRKRLIYLLLGLCAGLIGFALVELFGAAGFPSYLGLSLTQGASLGAVFGFVFGFSDGFFYKELKSGLIKGGIAAAIGAVTSAATLTLTSQGMVWSANLMQLDYEKTMGILFPLWRAGGWMVMGAAIGMVDGLHRRTLYRTLAGGLGGLTGGLLGGLSFEFLLRYLPEPAVARAAGLIIMGLLIGLFLGEFERRFAYARIRVLNGELKDREYLLIKRKILIGGDHRDDVFLYGYGELPAASIVRKNKEVYFLPAETADDPAATKVAGETETGRQAGRGLMSKARAAAAPPVTLVNDEERRGEEPLKYQDVIQLGRIKLLYMPL